LHYQKQKLYPNNPLIKSWFGFFRINKCWT